MRADNAVVIAKHRLLVNDVAVVDNDIAIAHISNMSYISKHRSDAVLPATKGEVVDDGSTSLCRQPLDDDFSCGPWSFGCCRVRAGGGQSGWRSLLLGF